MYASRLGFSLLLVFVGEEMLDLAEKTAVPLLLRTSLVRGTIQDTEFVGSTGIGGERCGGGMSMMASEGRKGAFLLLTR